MSHNETNSCLLAIRALGWTLGEPSRASRLLSLTGLTPDALRAGLDQPAMQAAILAFLEAHEPDLTACAEELGVDPAELVAARQELEA